MSTKELYASLQDLGWSFASSLEKTGVSWYAYRRLVGGKECSCNEKAPSLCIQPYSTDIGDGRIFESAQFEIRGQISSGEWVEFEVYGIALEDVVSKIESVTKTLLTAWNSVAQLGE